MEEIATGGISDLLNDMVQRKCCLTNIAYSNRETCDRKHNMDSHITNLSEKLMGLVDSDIRILQNLSTIQNSIFEIKFALEEVKFRAKQPDSKVSKSPSISRRLSGSISEMMSNELSAVSPTKKSKKHRNKEHLVDDESRHKAGGGGIGKETRSVKRSSKFRAWLASASKWSSLSDDVASSSGISSCASDTNSGRKKGSVRSDAGLPPLSPRHHVAAGFSHTKTTSDGLVDQSMEFSVQMRPRSKSYNKSNIKTRHSSEETHQWKILTKL